MTVWKRKKVLKKGAVVAAAGALVWLHPVIGLGLLGAYAIWKLGK